MDEKKPLTVEEAAQILKISKYTLYELIKRGEIPAQRIGRQIRIDPGILNKYLEKSSRNTGFSEMPDKNLKVLNEIRFNGSHDPIVDLLIDFWKHSYPQQTIEVSYNGSMEGLIDLYKDQADIAGVHLWDEKTGEYNLPFVYYLLHGESVLILNLVQRVQGWIVPKGNPLGIEKWEDLARKGLRFVNRQKGSGTRIRIDSYLRNSSISAASLEGYDLIENTHYGVAYRVANGEADAGIGVKAAAMRLGLDFVPLFNERYDLVCTGKHKGIMEQISTILNSYAFHTAIQSHAGYDTSLTGKVMKSS